MIADRADGAQHQLLLLAAGRPRRPREQDRLHRPVADVGLRERHVDALTGLLDRRDALVERGGERLGPSRLEQLVGLAELDERHRDVPVLGVARAAPQLARVRRRQQPGEIERRTGRRRAAPTRAPRARASSGTIPSRALPEQLGRELPCRGDAERDLARARRRLGRDAGARIRAGHDQLAMDAADEEEVERAAVHPDRHLQPHRSRRRRASAHAGERVLHAEGRGTRALRVAVAAEEQQDRVPSELEQVGVLGVGGADQLAERRVDDARDLLGSLAAAPGERLGQLGEAGDVGEDERAVEAARPLVRRLAQPVDRDARHERAQRIGRCLEPGRGRGGHGRDRVALAREPDRAPHPGGWCSSQKRAIVVAPHEADAVEAERVLDEVAKRRSSTRLAGPARVHPDREHAVALAAVRLGEQVVEPQLEGLEEVAGRRERRRRHVLHVVVGLRVRDDQEWLPVRVGVVRQLVVATHPSRTGSRPPRRAARGCSRSGTSARSSP